MNFDSCIFVQSDQFREAVGTVFRVLHPFTDEDINILADFYREIWLIKNRNLHLQAKRLELLCILKNQNQQKIFTEKQKLLAQLEALETLAGSSLVRVSAESI
jgi:hypothetical protein